MTEHRWLRRTAPALALAALLTGCSGGGGPAATGPAPATAVPAAAGPSVTGGTVVPLTPDVAAQLDSALQDVLRRASVPGAIVALTVPGSQSYRRTFGVADKATGAPMDTGLNMRIGSVTKTFTVTAVLRLVDQGRVGLDDPIGRWVDGVPNGDRITIRQLAGMRSGLYSYSQDQDFVNAFLADPHRQFTPQQLLAYSFRHPVNFEPGATFEYSNTNTVLLGLVVEKVGGQPLDAFIKQQVSDPAGLRRTVFPVDAAFPDPHAHGYTTQTPDGSEADATGWNPSWAWAAGAMISDLADQQVWAQELATGTLLSPQTQAARLAMPPTSVPDTRYGLGIFDNHGWLGHNGSLPGYQALTLYLPSARATLVVMLNTDTAFQGSEPSTLVGKAITQIVSPANVYDLPAAPASPTGSPSGSPSAATPTASPTTLPTAPLTPAPPSPTGLSTLSAAGPATATPVAPAAAGEE